MGTAVLNDALAFHRGEAETLEMAGKEPEEAELFRLMTSGLYCTPKDLSMDISCDRVSLGLNSHKKRDCMCLGFLRVKGNYIYEEE